MAKAQNIIGWVLVPKHDVAEAERALLDESKGAIIAAVESPCASRWVRARNRFIVIVIDRHVPVSPTTPMMALRFVCIHPGKPSFTVSSRVHQGVMLPTVTLVIRRHRTVIDRRID